MMARSCSCARRCSRGVIVRVRHADGVFAGRWDVRHPRRVECEGRLRPWNDAAVDRLAHACFSRDVTASIGDVHDDLAPFPLGKRDGRADTGAATYSWRQAGPPRRVRLRPHSSRRAAIGARYPFVTACVRRQEP